MRQINTGTPQQVRSYEKRYTQFRGVDFSTDSTQVSDVRSPEAQNIISDMQGFPEKRPGWRYIHKLNEPIYNLFYAVFSNGERHRFCHVGTKLYTWDETDADPVLAVEGIAERKSTAFVHAGKLYLLDGEKYQVVTKDNDGFHIANAADNAYVPTVRISITGNAITQVGETDTFIGGHTYEEHESPNYLTSHRKCTMIGDATSTIFHLPEEKVEEIVNVTVDGVALAAETYTLDAEKGHLTFVNAPAVAADGAGLANIEVEYTCTPEDEEKSIDRITKCTIVDQFGFYNDNRFFFTGENNRKYQNVDYMSATDDPTYFPYDGFVRVGADTSRIMGYMKQYDAQLIIKEDNEQDAQIFARTAMLDDETGTLFPVQQGIKGVGAVSPYAMGVLRDDPMFLAEEGVFSIVSSAVKDHRSVQDRSFFVNARLQKELYLKDAIATTWNGYFILCVNGKCYVADARQKTALSSTEEIGYEWYYWTNIPARVFFVHDGELFFGSENNAICKFNTDIERVKKYSDGAYPMIKLREMTEEQLEEYNSLEGDRKSAYRESIEMGDPIVAIWATKADAFDTIINVKNILKKGCAIMVKPYTRSSIEMGYLTDREGRVTIRTEYADILDFSDIDFGRFTFNSLDFPMVIPIGKKIKKFNILQIFLINRELNEGFGVYGIQLTYSIGGFVK